MIVIGRGTDPNLNNEVTIAADKMVLQTLEENRPAGGYPAKQEEAIQEMKDRIDAFEAEHGEVDPKEVSAKQDAERDAMLKMLMGLAKGL